MIKTITKEICDLCKKEVPTKKYTIPVYRTFDSTEGKLFYSSKQFSNAELDICEECIDKITCVHSIGVQCDEYKINKALGGNDEESKVKKRFGTSTTIQCY